MKLGIIGGGAWGHALATLAAEAGHQPRMGIRAGARVRGLPGTPNLAALAAETDLLVLAVPPAAVREVVQSAAPGPASRVLIASRGLEPGTGAWLSDLVGAHSACRRVGALAGPALAAEVLARRPCALVAASPVDEVGLAAQTAFHSAICRVYTSRDLRGVELAGALVRTLAVAVGLAEGLGLGLGVRGVIVTRGLAEGRRLGRALGTEDATFSGLAGVGDLVASGAHPEHPGFAAGMRLANGGPPAPATEGEARALLERAARSSVELPLTAAIAEIASGRLKPRLAIDALMRRSATAEAG
jgi:glycerol-3-phosphate dehydrogenase (NAD(P)+)